MARLPSTLLFLHIPKTAGTSVRRRVSLLFDHAATLPNAHDVRKQSVDPNLYQFVWGHVTFKYVAKFQAKPIVLTFLRHPVERAVSAWSFFRHEAKNLIPQGLSNLPRKFRKIHTHFCRRASELSLLELLEQEPELARSHLSNEQTRCLLSRSRDARLSPPTNAAELSEAIENLRRCDVVGLVEKMDESMAWLASTMGWESLGPLRRDNRSSQRSPRELMDPQALAILTKWNQLDLDLYRHALELFDCRRPTIPPRRTAALPSIERFHFDQPIHGAGWHDREFDEHGCFCWTSAEEESRLDFQPVKAACDHVLTCRIAHAIHLDALAGLQATVNGTLLAGGIRQQGAETVFEAFAPASVVSPSNGRLRLSLRTEKRMRPCDVRPGAADQRVLGVAIRSIQLRPANR